MWPAAAPCRSTSISKSEKQQKDWQKWQRCANRKEPSPGADSLRIRLEELEVSPSFKLYGLNRLNWCGWEWMGMDGNGVSGWSGYLQLRMTLWWGSSKPASVIRGTSIRIMGTGHGWQGPSSTHWRWQKNVSKAMQKRRCDFKTLMSPVLEAWLNPCFLTLNELERDAPAQRILDKCCDMLWLSTEIGSFRCFRQSQETPLLLPVQVCPRQRWCPRCIAGFSSLSQDQQVSHSFAWFRYDRVQPPPRPATTALKNCLQQSQVAGSKLAGVRCGRREWAAAKGERSPWDIVSGFDNREESLRNLDLCTDPI